MDMVIVTNWEVVEKDSFYLTEEWAKNSGNAESIQTCLEALAEGDLYVGYLVEASNYLEYGQMDAQEVCINSDFEILMYGEGVVIGNQHTQVGLYNC